MKKFRHNKRSDRQNGLLLAIALLIIFSMIFPFALFGLINTSNNRKQVFTINKINNTDNLARYQSDIYRNKPMAYPDLFNFLKYKSYQNDKQILAEIADKIHNYNILSSGPQKTPKASSNQLNLKEAYEFNSKILYDPSVSGQLKEYILNGTDNFKIICSFSEKPPAYLYTLLNENEIKPIKVWDTALYGFSAEVSLEQLKSLYDILDILNLKDKAFIEYDNIRTAQMYVAAKQMNVRSYVWDTLGYKGDNLTSIAILDTGIDDSHPNLSPYGSTFGVDKIVGWHDSTSLGSSTPIDDHGHGSHCSGISAGKGFETTDAQSRLVITAPLSLNLTGKVYSEGTYRINLGYFNVSKAGTIMVRGYFSDQTSDPNGHVYGRFAIYQGDTQLNISAYNTASSWNDVELTYYVSSSNLGVYNIRAIFEFANDTGSSLYNPDFYYDFVAHYPYQAPTDGYKYLTGISQNSSLVGVKVLSGSGSGQDSWVIDGINWAITNKNTYHITVLSMSLGGKPFSMSEYLAVENAVNAGIVVVVAAGNDGPEENTLGEPGNADSVITVAALTYEDAITSYSSEGGCSYTGFTRKPDIAAPGGTFTFPIYSTDSNDGDEFFSEKYLNDAQPMQGTSMATPAVSGAASLLIDAMGGWGSWTFSRAQVMKVKNLLLMTTSETNELNREDCGPEYSPTLDRGGKDVHEGYGRINIEAAITAATISAQLGQTYQETLYSSGTSVNNHHVWARNIHLTKGMVYNFTLDVPAGADFDIYLYNETPQAYGDPIIVAKSTTSGSSDENLVVEAPYTGVFYLVVKAVSGSGQFTLNLGDHSLPKVLKSWVNPSEGTSDIRTISVQIMDTSSVSAWAKVEHYDAYTSNNEFGEVIANLTLYDDGNHNDGAASDNVFANTINVSGYPNGNYGVDYIIYDSGLGRNITYPFTSTAFYVGNDVDGPDGYIIPDKDSVIQGEKVLFSGHLYDPSGISSASVRIYDYSNTLQASITLYDDGSHSDMLSGDNFWAGELDTSSISIGSYYYSILMTDNSASSNSRTLTRFGYINITDTPMNNSEYNYDMHVNVSYSWVTGANSLGFTDDQYSEITLAHSFPFYDKVFTKVNVSANGFIVFGPVNTTTSYHQVKFPSRSENPYTHYMIAPMWADIYMGSGQVYYTTTTSYSVFEYYNVNVIIGSYYYSINSFEVIIYPNGTIKFQYNNPTTKAVDAFPTIGINRGGNNNLETSFYQLDDVVGNNRAVKFIPPVKDECKQGYTINFPQNNQKIIGNKFQVNPGEAADDLDLFEYRIYATSNSSYINSWTSNTNSIYTLSPGNYILETRATDAAGNTFNKNYNFEMIGKIRTHLTSVSLNNDSKMVVNWTQADDVTSYKLYKTSSSITEKDLASLTPYITINDPSNTSFVDHNETRGVYHWTIVGSNSHGESWLSDEIIFNYNPASADTDGDGLSDYDEINIYHTDPNKNDTDDDLLNDSYEVFTPGYDPLDPDVDDDYLKDGYELIYGTNPFVNDTDSDGLLDGNETQIGTNPLNNDTDSDTLLDGYEVSIGTNPLSNDTDSDQLADNNELTLGTNPLNNDTDNDGILDGNETKIGTNPLNNDTDSDDLLDGYELQIGTDPLKEDTDGDTYSDGVEVAAGTDPLDPNDYPGSSNNENNENNNNNNNNDQNPPLNPIYYIIIIVIFAGLTVTIIYTKAKHKKRSYIPADAAIFDDKSFKPDEDTFDFDEF
ncbi:MAG: S8 family serine peptidase [Promethearchaeota archaeon]